MGGFPYFKSTYLEIPEQVEGNLKEAHKKLIKEELNWSVEVAEVMGSNPVEALIFFFFFFQASSFQLLNWKIYYYRSTNMNYFIYISHDFTAREDMKSINWPCSQCVAS